MFDRIVRLFRRPTHEPEVLDAQREQLRKFEEWASTMCEVERVQKLAQGKPRRSRRVPH